MLTGGCRCGAIRYRMPEEVIHHSFCHCADCRRSAGAPLVSWAGVKSDALVVEGEPREYRSSENTTRSFCGTCGTGLFYVNEAISPGAVDVQSATLDHPERIRPTKHVQVAERIDWMRTAHELPEYERFPASWPSATG
jgi:hypothetical protein